MATNIHRVYQNFSYWLEQISPTASDGNPKDRFFEVDLLRNDPDESGGYTRGFGVTWLGSDMDAAPTDLYDRWAQHEFMLDVFYSTKLKYETLNLLILKDRHDIIKQLRDSANFVGYSAANPTDDIGLENRVRLSDELDTGSPTIWTLRQRWRCLIQEVE